VKKGTLRKTKSTKTLGPTFINDAVTEASKTAEVLEEIKPENFKDADFQGRREIARKCFTREDLHYHASHAILLSDAVIVEKLRATLGVAPDYHLGEDCRASRILPFHGIDWLGWIHLFAHALLPARAAENLTGVPASLLLAECQYIHIEFDGKCEIENDVFGTGVRFASLQASFLEHAVRLATDKAFEPVWLVAHDPARYLEELRRCELWDEDTRLNLADSILSYHLQNVDRPQVARTSTRLSA
jgi:hypothetical protein